MSLAAPGTDPGGHLEIKLPATIGTAHQVLRNSGTAGTLEFTHNHFFEVKLSANQTGYDGSGSSLTTLVAFDSENYDLGNNFNTSTHLFTVPETGLYQFIGSTYNDEVVSSQAWLVINGSRGEYTDWTQDDNAQILCSTHMKYLTAADTVGYHLHTNDASSTIYQNQWHTWFKGYKVH